MLRCRLQSMVGQPQKGQKVSQRERWRQSVYVMTSFLVQFALDAYSAHASLFTNRPAYISEGMGLGGVCRCR